MFIILMINLVFIVVLVINKDGRNIFIIEIVDVFVSIVWSVIGKI